MTLSETCVKRPVFATMLITFLVVLGVFSFRELGVDLFPRADPATISIIVRLPGASPEEVTTQVVFPIEDAVSTISGLDELTATVSEGGGRIRCQFILERDIDSAAQDVREKIGTAMRNMPPNLLPLVIQKLDPDAEPILKVAVAGKGSLRETSEIADKQIRRALETIDGVGEVSMLGLRQRQIRVFIDAEKLSAYAIPITQVHRAIQNENVDLPGGRIVRGASEVGVRTMGRIDAVGQFRDIIVANVNGTPIRLSDLGRVEDTHGEIRTWNMLDGQDAITLEIRRQSGSNTVKIADAVKVRLATLQKSLPPGITMRIIQDTSLFIKASIASLEEHLLYGSILASLVVLLFIRNLRSVLIAALAIPTSIIATFTLLKAMDFTLNNMTLLALTLSVGIVIDDAIVVLENIVRYIEEKGYPPVQAAVEATREIALAVLATTISLVVIFVPIAFMTGYARRYLNEFGWTMALSVMFSMLVAFTLTPMLSAKMLRRYASEKGAEGAAPHHLSKDSRSWGSIRGGYGRLLAWSLDHRAVVVLVALGTFALTFPLYSRVGRDFIPPDDQSELNVSYYLPEGTSVEGTATVGKRLTEKIRHVRGVEFVNPFVHEGGGFGASNHAHIYVRLVDVSERDYTNHDVAADIRGIIQDEPNLRSRISFPSALQSGENFFPIQVRILGSDFLRCSELAQKAAVEARKVPGLLDVDTGVRLNNPELQVKVDRKRAADLGVRVSDVANAIRLMMSGEDQISTYKEGDEQYDVTMQLLPEQRNDPNVLSRVVVPSSKLGLVRLDNLATVERGLGPARIERFNRQFQVGVNANHGPDFPLESASRAVVDAVNTVGLPQGYSYRSSGNVKMLDETAANLVIAFLLASIFMYMVLAAQFESFVHPFSIMLSIPLSIPFALLTLWATGRTLNLWSALGILLLLGIVKKNGILQIDYTNKLRAQGYGLRDAILEANDVRLRPILMTTFAIVAGLIPTALGLGAGSAQRSAIAVTIIGGQTLCLLLTLVVTPVAYSLFAELGERSLFARAGLVLTRWKLGAARMFNF